MTRTGDDAGTGLPAHGLVEHVPGRWPAARGDGRRPVRFPLPCRYCGAEMKIIAFVTEIPSVRAILEHTGKPPHPPALASAHAPPWEDALVKLEPDYDPLAQPEPAMEFDQRIYW